MRWLSASWMRRLRSRRLRRLRSVGERRAEPSAHPELTHIDLAMMKRAIELGRRAAAQGEVPVGAVIYRGPDIIAEAYNVRENPADPLGHAELLAISLATRRLGQWRLNDCSLAVTLEPCPMCAGAMVNARLGRLIYGATDPKAGACESLYQIPIDPRLNHRVKMIGGVMADECGQLLTQFFRERRTAKKQSSPSPPAPPPPPPLNG